MATEPRNAYALRTAAAEIDVGLRRYMLSVYNYMAAGLALTGIVALATASSPAMTQAIFGTPLMWVVLLAPLGLVFFMSFRLHKMSFATAQITFWIYAALNGLAFASIFLVYTQASIARVFFVSAAMFAAMSLYGYTTKRDLFGWGPFLYMGLIGVFLSFFVEFAFLIAAVYFANESLVFAAMAVQFAFSVIGVLVFVGLTAYDTQRIKEWYVEGDAAEAQGKKAIFGALNLYLDFINLFFMLLRLFGNRQ